MEQTKSICLCFQCVVCFNWLVHCVSNTPCVYVLFLYGGSLIHQLFCLKYYVSVHKLLNSDTLCILMSYLQHDGFEMKNKKNVIAYILFLLCVSMLDQTISMIPTFSSVYSFFFVDPTFTSKVLKSLHIPKSCLQNNVGFIDNWSNFKGFRAG